jgi:SNF2 family DNA or RNA helicase
MVSEAHQFEEPPQFFGGIVADPMGLGKTLTMIALVATDLQGKFAPEESACNIETNKTTLVVVPPPRAC